ncbi:MAG: SDR family oxidoreductase [Methanobacteriota archaeon]|nr:MAG: SDR family oxidoreductase [Euryarchaeota archaeon]
MYKELLLRDKVVLITGGGSGLGLGMAKMYAYYGATVIIASRNEEKLKNALEQLSKPVEQDHTYYVVDVRDAEQVKTMYDKLFEKFDKIDILINNAAGNFLSLSEKLTPNGFKTVVDIVLNGTFYNSLYWGQHCIESGTGGCILNIATTYAIHGSAFVLPSAAAKAGVLAMTKSLAYEWAQYGIRVNAIAPGPIPTKGAWDRLIPNQSLEKLYQKSIPLHRFGTHEELANLAIFLTTDLSGFITGECVVMDGGESLRAGEFNILDQLADRKTLGQMFEMLKKGRRK